MKINELSITFHTKKVKECVEFYSKYFNARTTFDWGWYAVVLLESSDSCPIQLSFQDSPDGMERVTFTGGVTLNLKVDDVDGSYEMLKKYSLPFIEEIIDHQWGDRVFSLYDPIGNVVYIYSDREVGAEYKDAIQQ